MEKPNHFPVTANAPLVFLPLFLMTQFHAFIPQMLTGYHYLPEIVLGSFFYLFLPNTYHSPGQILGAQEMLVKEMNQSSGERINRQLHQRPPKGQGRIGLGLPAAEPA